MTADPWLAAAPQAKRMVAPPEPLPQRVAEAQEVPAAPVHPAPAQRAELWIHGVSGGCGETRVAQLSPTWVDGHHGWPTAAAPVLLVARTSGDSLVAAAATIAQWSRGELPISDLAGIVLIADAPGRLPPPLAQLRRHVLAGAGRHWDVGWSTAWRLGDPDALAPGIERLLRDLAPARTL